MKRNLLAALFAAGSMLALPAFAYPFTIPTGSSPADDLILNFDFKSPPQTPAPPYSFVIVSLTIGAGLPLPPTVVLDFFGDLNGTDFLSSSTTTWLGGILVTNSNLNSSEFRDGQFSLGLHMTAGAAQLFDTRAIATFDGVATGPVQGTVAAVPEPATLALLGVGLAGLGFSRRKQ